MKNASRTGVAALLLAALLPLSASAQHALPHWTTNFDDFFARGQMSRLQDPEAVDDSFRFGLPIYADGKGRLSVEAYLDGELIGVTEVKLEDVPGEGTDAVRVLRLKMELIEGPADPVCTLTDDQFTFSVGTYLEAGDTYVIDGDAQFVISVRGNVDIVSVGSKRDSPNPEQAGDGSIDYFTGSGMGEAIPNFYGQINY